ncbi:MAG TPA: PaaX family transcriptional regulator C-terminal domain-containing protein [Acidimicrobiales bacterium]|nr:PaaX family transcriptional regulator C-terminal domain-containing protein [Acidimicrobiales bacterium]
MPDRALRPRSGSSAKALLLTILGEFVLPHGEAAWTGTLVGSLGALGVEEGNARQAVARLADQHLVRSERDGRRVRWHLTTEGRHLLTTGTERIYRFGAGKDEWDRHWLVVLCSVPEEQRARRHQLRSRLGFAGFGFLSPAVALSPHLDREDTANDILKDLDLLPGAVVLRAEAGELVPAEELLRRAWDLDGLHDEYRAFLDAFERRTPRSDDARFAALVELVHRWRRFPFVDPEIPDRLLPARWPGRRAKAVFDEKHRAWAPGANQFFEALEDGAR